MPALSEHRREQVCRASRNYCARNPGFAAHKSKRWRAANPRAVSASLAAARAKRATARQNAKWFVTRPVKAILCQARRRAKIKNIPFAIVAADLLPLPTHCPVLGMKLAYGPGRGRKLYENGSAASLDRIRNELGYIKGNVIVISLRANLLKGQATLDELQKIAAFYGGFAK